VGQSLPKLRSKRGGRVITRKKSPDSLETHTESRVITEVGNVGRRRTVAFPPDWAYLQKTNQKRE